MSNYFFFDYENAYSAYAGLAPPINVKVIRNAAVQTSF